MANTFESNFTRKVTENVIDRFEASRVLSKNVNTQLLAGQFNENSGTQVDVKRPTDHTVISSSDGDISTTRSDIITGKATATVQNYITVAVDFDEVDQELKMGDLSRYWDDIANRMTIDLETKFASFMVKNTALLQGTHGQGVNAWSEVAYAGALMQSSGVPMNKKWCYALNPYSQAALADQQRGIGVSPDANSANESATVMSNYAGFDVKTCTTLPTYLNPTAADLVGAVTSNPDVTYATAKDSMTQSIVVEQFSANAVVPAGAQVQVTGVNRLNLSTRNAITDATGANIVWTGTVTEEVTLSGTGTGTLVVTGPAIYEAAGAYNTASRAIVATDVITILGATATTYQPNLFWHPDAFTIASVPMKKLYSTDTLATTADGLQMRVSKFSDGAANKQTVRFDLHPAFGCLNPFFAGQAFGTA